MSDFLFGNFGSDLFREFDRLQQHMSTLRGGFPTSLRSAQSFFPPINVGTTDDSIEIVVFAPGFEASQFDVSIDKGILTIAGERKRPQAATSEDTRSYARERFMGAFRRVVELPQNANPDDVQAKYVDGCLSIRIGKRESSKPRSVTVQ
ncbi:Hsp20/alpha crystallin family protein [Trinickia diaoshuihuensis]|jgi:HSP20 family protein|uniref:Hsp20/alpha crystallin family protein n=1 Tax=Trinickia diaoshuihuensis TaxID=2292265 RepID=UPI000E22D26B|nr:Hsp20/alpha crystallin family protein [Trinickia diaoshuihuensis]